MSNQVNSMNKGLTVKDLVTTGIFTALLFVFVLVGGVFFATNPVLTFFMPAGGGLLAGPIYLLLIAKVHKRWSLSIMGVIMGIIWFVTGMHWAFALGYLIMAIVADFVAGAGQYKSKKLNSLSYILFSLGGTGSYIVFFADPNGWAQTMLGNGTEQSYIDTMQATARRPPTVRAVLLQPDTGRSCPPAVSSSRAFPALAGGSPWRDWRGAAAPPPPAPGSCSAACGCPVPRGC